MSGDEKIRCPDNGPYIVTGLERFFTAEGEAIEVRPAMALCRCGGSGNKPFCDGTHASIAFTGDKLDGRVPDKRDTYEAGHITIYDNRGICSHAGYCTRDCPAVFEMGEEPWIDADGSTPDRIIETIKECPSGALSYGLSGEEYRDQDRAPSITVSKDGPYHVVGGVDLEAQEWGEGASREHFALCRCGGSKNKPFCDGTHWSIDFKDSQDGAAKSASADDDETELTWYRVGDVDVVPEGRVMELRAGSHHQVAVATVDGKHAALCNKCPHQGGPLGEGTIENGRLRCPWHGWDFDPLTGESVDGNVDHVDTYPCEVRDDGLYVGIHEATTPVRTISDVMAETMVNWGIDTVFGIVGGSNLGLADALRRQEEDGKLRYFGVRHEGAAAFACSAYAKLTGKPAACLGIAGPGSTNLLTGLWDAKVDRAPILALSGQVQTQVFGPGGFQDIDLQAAFAPVVRFGQLVLHKSDHAELMSLAVKTAIVERDVSHLVFPDEVQVLPAGDGVMPAGPTGRVGPSAVAPLRESVDPAIERIGQAKRPLIIAGYGARDGMDAVISLAEDMNAAIVTTFKAKGQIPDSHPLAGGVLGRSGTPIASWLMNEADLLVVFGASFSNHTGIAPKKDTIQVDFDRMALGKQHPVTIPVWGDVAVTAGLIQDRLPDRTDAVDQREDVAARWALWSAEKKGRQAIDRGNGVNSAAIFESLTRLAPENAVIAVDVGNNTYSFGRYFEVRNQSILMSGYLGSIGFAFPAAMGAWAADTGRPILSVGGDGGFGQYMGDFTTAVKYGMNITHVLVNNSQLGKITDEQLSGSWKVWQTSLHNPNFAEFARNCGGHGQVVDDASQLDAALEAALAFDGPSIVEICSDPELV